MSGLVDVVPTDIVPVISTSVVSSEETKTTAIVAATTTSESSDAVGTLAEENVIIPSELKIAEKQEQPREEVEIVQKANEDDEVIGDVVNQFDKAVTLNPQKTMQQIQAVPSHLSAGMHRSYILL